MKVKVWLKQQRIPTELIRPSESCPYTARISSKKMTKTVYETDMSVAEGLETFYSVIEKFVNEVCHVEVCGFTVIDDSISYSFEIETKEPLEVYRTVIETIDLFRKKPDEKPDNWVNPCDFDAF